MVARAKASVCDVAEMCSGSSATVAPNAFKPSSFIVHPSTSSDNCDPTERCSGNSSVVPANLQQCTQVAIKVLGQSGKFTIYNNDTGTSDPNRVTVELDSLYELAANGAQVGKAGSSKHSINTFASQNFSIAKPVDAELNSKLSLVGPVSATKVSFSSTVGSVGVIEVDVLIMKNAGTIGSDKESWAVRANDVKFNIVLKDWKWCGGAATCKQGKAVEVGAFVDVAVKIKGKGTPTKSTKPGANKTVALGAGVALELSDRVSVDGKWAAMPAGYPKMSTVGGSVVFTFRFPKFSKIATYDPVVGMGCSAGANGQPCQNGGTAMGTSGNCKCSCASGVSGTNCEATKAPTRQPTSSGSGSGSGSGSAPRGPCGTAASPLKRGTVCRTATTVCDAAEACDGVKITCPADAFLPSTATARSKKTACDVAEYCASRASNTSPAPAPAPVHQFPAQGASVSRRSHLNSSSADDSS